MCVQEVNINYLQHNEHNSLILLSYYTNFQSNKSCVFNVIFR